jgi:hypothetical protein
VYMMQLMQQQHHQLQHMSCIVLLALRCCCHGPFCAMERAVSCCDTENAVRSKLCLNSDLSCSQFPSLCYTLALPLRCL